MIHYLVPETATHPVIRSQAIGTASMLSRHLNQPVCYYGLYREDDAHHKKQARALQSEGRAQGVDIRLYPNPRGQGPLAILSALGRIALDVRCALRKQPGPVLARGLFGATLAQLATCGLRKTDYVVDLRGHTVAEFEANGWIRPRSLHSRLLSQWESFLLQHAAAVLCVSGPLAEHVGQRVRNAPTCYVVPCCLDPELESEIEATAAAIGTSAQDSPLIIAYAGSATPWNQIGGMVSFFGRLRNTFASATFLCLTTHLREARFAFEAGHVPHDSYRLLSVSHALVIQHLRRADVGLLLRDDTIVNRVASPVKVGEYLAAGLAPVVTQSTGDMGAILCQERAGLVLPSASPGDWNFDEIEAFLRSVLADRSVYRRRAVQTARRHFVRANYANTYRMALGV